MTTSITIRPAGIADINRLDEALRRLSDDIGDDHRASPEDLLVHGFGPSRAFRALLAEEGNAGPVVGAVVYSHIFSTVRAAAGLYVSDLWVSPVARGTGLGKRLLSAALDTGPESWTIGFIRLAVYDDNASARDFYDRLGFTHDPHESYLTLTGDALSALKDTP